MTNFLKRLLLMFGVPLVLLGTSGSAAAFDLFGNACTGKAANSPACTSANNQGTKNPVVDTINTGANIIALATGIAAVVMIIIGALTIATSGGNAEAVTGARRRIIFSLVGVAVVALAWTITRFITDKVIS